MPRPGERRNELGMFGHLRLLASDLASRAGLASAAGITFGGKRDTYTVLGYKKTLEVRDYRDRYERGDISQRIVEAYPKATWRGGSEVIEEEDPEVDTDFEQQWDALDKRVNIWGAFSRADILAGLGRYAVILIGAKGKPETPLPRLRGQEDVLYLSTYCEDEAALDTFDENTESPRFGQPLTYKIRRIGTKRTLDRQVHWSRVIHVADGVTDEPLYGKPRLKIVWNRLDDLDKVVGGGSEAFWIRVHQGTLLNVNPEVKVSEPELTRMREQAEDFINGFRRMMTLRGVDMSNLGSDVSNFGPQVTSILSLISGATGIPQRMLLGSERGELASTQDKENWDDRVSDRRTEFAEPVVRSFVDRLIESGGLPQPQQYEVRWPGIEELNETEKAEVATEWAGLNGKAKGVVVLPEEIRDRVLKLPKLTPKQIREVEEKTKANTPPPPPQPGDEPVEDDETRVVVED
jgi:hypothetical protein